MERDCSHKVFFSPGGVRDAATINRHLALSVASDDVYNLIGRIAAAARLI